MNWRTRRPVCACCGKRYGQRYTSMEVVRWANGDTAPVYRGNLLVVQEVKDTRATWNGSLRVDYRYLWDGETYRAPYRPFCTLRCALSYARAAHSARVSEPGVQS